ncbi:MULTISPECIES: transglycosylase SLT domain-containing protein [unclassified Streptomyces]|uniref:transglycosylase SLT domain-containing protein n=1 Tax=unclassified Streptomyces TaxID=2593676 RepID=UPI0005A62A8C|nr:MULTISPECIES: transglycosylase SLT domain-containing protein [unclassified Streptomyces]ODA72515.1 Transglycosylase SLT domain protein [Streptomyces sp. AVP053U2]
MSKNFLIRGHARALNRHHKVAVAGVAAFGAAAIGFSATPSDASTTTTSEAASTARIAYSTEPIKDVRGTVTDQLAGAGVKTELISAKKKAATDAAAKKKAGKKAAAAAAEKRAERERESDRAGRSGDRQWDGRQGDTGKPARKDYADNLDGWIRESLDIMKKRGIPGSYEGIHRNIIRESSGNPKAINLWDINAQNGIPSKGLLQVIPPTFSAYHVPGTSKNIYDPVANITAACNYAADRYGSMDNVNSAY